MNTGNHAWEVPVGMASERVTDHPALRELNLDPEALGGRGRAVLMATKSLLFAMEGIDERAVLHAHDKTTGEKLGTVDLPAPGQYGMMTYLHAGRQYVVVQIGEGGSFPGSLAALALPHDETTER